MQSPRLIDILFSFDAGKTYANLKAAGCLRDDVGRTQDIVAMIEVGIEAYQRVVALRPEITGTAPYLGHILMPMLAWAELLTPEARRMSETDTSGGDANAELVACGGCNARNHVKAVYCCGCGGEFSN